MATNAEGAWAARLLRAGASRDEVSYRYAKRAGIPLGRALHLVASFADEARDLVAPSERPRYLGRATYLEPDRLKEIWLHLTDRCNLACHHCLVSSGPAGEEGLPGGQLRGFLRQACDLGAETFYFTGGEPLLHPHLLDLLAEVTTSFRATAVLMTNGTLLDEELCARLAALPRERLFLQVSLDGSGPERNDPLRSPGSFAGAARGIREALAAGLSVTVATVVLRANLDDLMPLADRVQELGVRQLHLLWQHLRERGARLRRAPTRELSKALLALIEHAQRIGLVVDNLEQVRRVVNGDPHVKYDLSNACWDSLAIYRDGRVFPSACLVRLDSQAGGSLLRASLKDIWLGSELLARQRARSVVHSAAADADPLLFLHGGGDPEQAFFAGNGAGREAADPYLPVHRMLARRVIDETVHRRQALIGSPPPGPVVYHVMGEDGYGCLDQAGARNGGEHRVAFIHSNCVLIPDVIARARAQIERYYQAAASQPKAEICSPVAIEPQHLAHIPREVIARSYGCGSPVFAAALRPGETVIDLGSGAGLECFIASRLVGGGGRVIGLDMTREMLRFAGETRAQVAARLGYDNTSFHRALLEELPLADGQADAVISNCVVNLSPEKLRALAEIRRVLKPGGRAVISDIVSQRPLPARMRLNPRLQGECIAGAMTEAKLLRSLEKLGFVGVEVLSRDSWRTVEGIAFDSITVRAWKPNEAPAVAYRYPGPFRAIRLDCGEELRRGVPAEVLAALLPPSVNGHHLPLPGRRPEAPPRRRDCLVCGAPLSYLAAEVALICHSCGRTRRGNARCESGHFICDSCHVGGHLGFIKAFCREAQGTDPIAIFSAMKESHPFPLHGPEHHALVPAAFLTAYRNHFGDPPAQRVEAAIERASNMPGGTCAFWGACSAALGIGIAYSAILGATPLSGEPRGRVQSAVSHLLAELGRLSAPRCCRRESYLVLKLGCELSERYLPHALPAGPLPPCDQTHLNRECIGADCPLHPASL